MTSILDRPAPQPDLVLAYADRPDAVVDVYVPKDLAPSRAVVYLHGGFWRQAFDRTHARPLAAALAADGAVVVLPEFRRVGGGGGWPITCTDVAEAFAALPTLLGQAGIPTGPVTLTGHSAGGHLTLWLVGQGVQVDRAVAIAPVGDLRDAVATGMGDGAAADFLGGNEPVDAADPAMLLDRVRPSYPVRILHGTADDVVPIDNSRGLVARHSWIDLAAIDGIGHFEPIDPETPTYEVVRAALLDPAGDQTTG